MILAIPRIMIKVTFLKHFAVEVWVSLYLICAAFISSIVELCFDYMVNTDTDKAVYPHYVLASTSCMYTLYISFILGWEADVTASYNGSFYFCGAFFIAGGLVASLIPAMWHCRPSKQLKITDQRQENSPAVEIYRIETMSTEFKINC